MAIGSGYLKTVRGELTFVGVLQKYFDDETELAISRNWQAESTRKQYINDYEIRILPELPYYKPLSEYEEEDFKEALNSIELKYNYGPERMSHYRNLIWKVYEAGIIRGLYEDKLWWEDLGVMGEKENALSSHESRVKRNVVNRRSFSENDQIKIFKWFSTLPMSELSGEALGIILMFFLPLRNHEVCALNYNDIDLIGNSNIFALWIYKSTKGSSDKIKAGGKTRNAPRILPINSCLLELVLSKRYYLEEEIKSGRVKLPSDINEIGELPIVSRGKNIEKRCKSADISLYAKFLFKKLNVAQNEIRESAKTLYSYSDIEEAEATAYLLRRNSCTQLFSLGLTEDEVQYCMGHRIEGGKLSREHYSNEEVLVSLHEKMETHPLNRLYSHINKRNELNESANIFNQKVELKAAKKNEKYELIISENEPQDKIKLEFNGCNCIETAIVPNLLYENSETLNMSNFIYQRLLNLYMEGM